MTTMTALRRAQNRYGYELQVGNRALPLRGVQHMGDNVLLGYAQSFVQVAEGMNRYLVEREIEEVDVAELSPGYGLGVVGRTTFDGPKYERREQCLLISADMIEQIQEGASGFSLEACVSDGAVTTERIKEILTGSGLSLPQKQALGLRYNAFRAHGREGRKRHVLKDAQVGEIMNESSCRVASLIREATIAVNRAVAGDEALAQLVKTVHYSFSAVASWLLKTERLITLDELARALDNLNLAGGRPKEVGSVISFVEHFSPDRTDRLNRLDVYSGERNVGFDSGQVVLTDRTRVYGDVMRILLRSKQPWRMDEFFAAARSWHNIPRQKLLMMLQRRGIRCRYGKLWGPRAN
ncbi:hypothetical protein ACFL31_03735 [Candidatus Margulisiibacteriota bacterium]